VGSASCAAATGSLLRASAAEKQAMEVICTIFLHRLSYTKNSSVLLYQTQNLVFMIILLHVATSMLTDTLCMWVGNMEVKLGVIYVSD
jgi:hypothetical protein